MIKDLLPSEVEISIDIEDEYESPEHALSFEQCDYDHSESIAEINKRLESGDLWAWCIVKVQVKWKQWTGVDYLGACSYKDEEDFKAGGYYESMLADAMEDLNNQVKTEYNAIQELVVRFI